MSNEEKKVFGSFPDDIKDALVLGDRYCEEAFSWQAMCDLKDSIEFFMEHYKDIISNFKDLGGIVTLVEDSDGMKVENERCLILGQWMLILIYRGTNITGFEIHCDLMRERATKSNELAVILQVREALSYEGGEKEINKILESKRDDKWNAAVVRGLSRAADEVKKSGLIGYGLSGGTIEKKTTDTSFYGPKTIIGKIAKTADKQTEYRDGE